MRSVADRLPVFADYLRGRVFCTILFPMEAGHDWVSGAARRNASDFIDTGPVVAFHGRLYPADGSSVHGVTRRSDGMSLNI